MSSPVKSFEILPKHNGYAYALCFELLDFYSINKQKNCYFHHCSVILKKFLLLFTKIDKLFGFWCYYSIA